MEPGNDRYIDADHLSASSQSQRKEVDRARLNGRMSWRAETDDINPWYQVDLVDNETRVAGVEMQGRPDGMKNEEYVMEYRVMASLDGESWENVTSQNSSVDDPYVRYQYKMRI